MTASGNFVAWIKDYLIELSNNNNFNYPNKLSIEFNINIALNKDTGVFTYAIYGIDSLYYIILPFFSYLEFKSRKGIDFELWKIALLLYKRGYFYSQEGRNLLVLISNNINKNRYSTKSDIPSINKLDVEKVFQQQKNQPPIQEDLLNFKPHIELVKVITSTKGKLVDVYENGILVQGSPFSSYREAQLALGLNPDHVIIGRYIDTGKIYQGKYTFISHSPQETC